MKLTLIVHRLPFKDIFSFRSFEMPRFLSNFSSRQSNVPTQGLIYSMPPAGLQNSERRSLRLTPQSGSTFKPNGNNSIRFVIPGQGWLMNDRLRLKMRLGVVHPNANAAHTAYHEGYIPSTKAIFSRIRILSNSDQRVLEDVEAYDVISRNLDKHLSRAGKIGDNDDVPVFLNDNFDASMNTVANAMTINYLGSPATESNVGVECSFDFDYLGLKESAYWPLMATSGLVIELQLNTPNQVLCRKTRGWIPGAAPADAGTWDDRPVAEGGVTYTVAGGLYYVVNNPTLLYDILLPPSSYLAEFEQKLTSDGIQIPYTTIDHHLFLNKSATEELYIGQKASSIRGLVLVQRSNVAVESSLVEHLNPGLVFGKNGRDAFSGASSEIVEKTYDGGKQYGRPYGLSSFQVRLGSEMIPVQPMEAHSQHASIANYTEFYQSSIGFLLNDQHVVRGGNNLRVLYLDRSESVDTVALPGEHVYRNSFSLNDAGSDYVFRHPAGFITAIDLQVARDVVSGENTLATQADMTLRINRRAAPDQTLREDVFIWTDNIAIIRPGIVERLI